MLEKIKQLFFKGTKEGKKNKYMLWLVGALVIGLLLTFFPFDKKTETPKINQVIAQTKAEPEVSYDQQIENRLQKILGKMEGVGKVEVMLTVLSGEEKVLAEDKDRKEITTEEADKSGGTSKIKQEDTSNKVVIQGGDAPYIIKEKKPEIGGVLVLAEGGDSPQVQDAILQAVSSLLNVPKHKIAVFKMVNN